MTNVPTSPRDGSSVWYPFDAIQTAEPIKIEKAKGIYLIDCQGRKIIDAIGSWWVNIHGHAHPLLNEALATQAANLEHVIFAGFTHEPALAFSHKITQVGKHVFDKVFYSDNGSTAVEVALKMAFQYFHNQGKPRRKVLAMAGAYHGDTFGAMATGDRSKFNEPFFPFLFEVDFIPFPDKDQEGQILSMAREKLQAGDYACFIFEPLIQGAAGMRCYTVTVLAKLIQLCREMGTLCIADEVFTGFFRTGTFFASDQLPHGQGPDIICLSKAITGGYMPLGATLCSQAIYGQFHTDNVYHTFFHGHSYTGNALALALANASFDLLMQPQTQDNIARIAAAQQAFAYQLRQAHPELVVHCLGTILSIHLQAHGDEGYFSRLKELIYAHFLDRNILMRPLGNVFYFLPMYCFTDEELNWVYQEIKLFLEKMQSGNI